MGSGDDHVRAARFACAKGGLCPIVVIRPEFRTRSRKILACILLLIGLWPGVCYASNYMYDANGRLVAVTAPDGSSVVYKYDAAGNILSIQPIAVGQLALFDFAPAQGAVGAQVTLQGSGFSTTISNNTVEFNGTVASVTSATANQLVVKVPASATTGLISVTVGTTTVNSANDFVVLLAPEITSFNPAFGSSGTAVTISGRGLDPVPEGTSLTLANVDVPITSFSNSQLLFSVPADVGSAPIHVTTPYGQASSSTDFIVIPDVIGAVNVVSAGYVVANSSARTLNINSQNKSGVFAFTGTVGHWLSLQLTSLTTTPSGGVVSYQVYSTNNTQATQIAYGTVSTASNMSVHLPEIPVTGIYLIVFDSGNDTVQLTGSLKIDTSVATTGTPVLLSTTTAAQSIRFTFSGSSGLNLGSITNLALNPTSVVDALITINNPDGTLDSSEVCYVSYGGCELNINNLPTTGTYSVIVSPDGAAKLSFDAALFPVHVGTLAIYWFAPQQGTIGSQVMIAGYGFSTTTSNNGVEFNGVPAVVISATSSQLVVTVPAGATTGPISVTVSGTTVTSTNKFGVVSVPPPPIITGFTPGIGSAGTSVTVTGTTLDPVSGSTTLSLAGTTVPLTSISNTQAIFTVPANVYSGPIQITTPYGQASSNIDFVVGTGTGTGADNTSSIAELSVGSAATSLNITAYTYGIFALNATAGQWLSVQLDSLVTTPIGATVPYEVYTPDGTLFAVGSVSTLSTGTSGLSVDLSEKNAIDMSIHLPEIPTSGTYLVIFWPNDPAAVQLSAVLEANPTIESNDAELVLTTNTPAQTKRFIFSGTTGESLDLSITNLLFNPSFVAYGSYQLYQPDGSYGNGGFCNSSSAGGCNLQYLNMPYLPQTGTYSVIVAPGVSQTELTGSATFNATATLVPNVTATLSANTPFNLNLAQPGQEGVLTFTATANESLQLALSGVSTTPADTNIQIDVYAPGGFPNSPPIDSYNINSDGTQSLAGLAAGNYTILVAPDNGATAAMTVTLTPGGTGVLQTNGTSQNFSTTTPGQTVTMTFNGTTGQNLGLGITNIVLTGATGRVDIAIFNPDGTTNYNFGCIGDSINGLSCNLLNLPQTGIYTIIVAPPSQATISYTATLSQDVSGTLAVGTPTNINLAYPGQIGLPSFTAAAGQYLAVQITGFSTNPSGGSMSVEISNQSGTVIAQYDISSSYTFNLTNLATGTYFILLEPDNAQTAQMTVNLFTIPTQSMGSLDQSVNYSTTTPGVGLALTFSGTAGEALGLGITNVTTNPASTDVYPTVYGPNGSTVASGGCTSSMAICAITMKSLPQTGNYTVLFVPYGQATMNFTATLSQDVAGTLTLNTPVTENLLYPGQNGLFTFVATAGENLVLEVQGIATNPANKDLWMYIYSPSGNLIATNYANYTVNFNLTNLSAGTYSVLVFPYFNDVGTASFQLDLVP